MGVSDFVRQWRGAGVATLLAGVLLIAGVGVRAQVSYARADDRTLSLRERIVAARDAAELKPSRIDYAERLAILSAEDMIATGRLDDAKRRLLGAYLADREDATLAGKLRQVNLALIARDARKAHQLHAKEGPGGILPPGVRMP